MYGRKETEMKKIAIALENDRQYREEFIMCREKHRPTLSHEYMWVGNEDSKEVVKFPISADVFVARYHHNGNDWTEMSIVHIQNGREDVVFYSEDLGDYEHFEETIENLNKKGFQRMLDCDY